MKSLTILFGLLCLIGVVAGFSPVQSNEYCPINPRKSGGTLVHNAEAFSHLLTCPLGSPRYGPLHGPSADNIWSQIYATESPNRYYASSNEDVFLFESTYTNGVNDPRQGACVQWEHAFHADGPAALLATGSGRPIIVAQDRRYEAIFLENNGTFGQWLFSICTDVSCAEASTPKPFWGRRIGEPLYQDSMAELAYFPFPPDWAYNSPRLGVTYPIAPADSYSGYTNNSYVTNLAPTDVAHTYVTSDSGEKLLVLLLNGFDIEKLDRLTPDILNQPSNSRHSSRDVYYLVWCQDEDCSAWGVKRTDIQVSSDYFLNTIRPSIATAADGQTVLVTTRYTPGSPNRLVYTFGLRDISVKNNYRNEAMLEIYSQLIGSPFFANNQTFQSPSDLIFQTDILLAYGGVFDDYHPLNWLYGDRGILPPLTYDDPSSTRPSIACVDLEASGIKADPWCTWNYYFESNVSDVNIGSFYAYKDSSPFPKFPLDHVPRDTFYDIVVDSCRADIYLLSSAAEDISSPTNERYYLSILKNGETINYWPPSHPSYSYYFSRQNYTYTQPAASPFDSNYSNPFPTRYPTTGRRFSAIEGANGKPFWTWADLGGDLLDAPIVWGSCALNSEDDFECRTVMDSIELGTMGFLNAHNGQTILLRGPEGLPAMIFWFDHFGGYLNQPISDRSQSVAIGQITSKPLIVLCLDAFCNSASVSAFAPSQMADVANTQYTGVGDINPTVNVDARFVDDDTLILMVNEGGDWGESRNNPIRLWRTNRWASPTGLPCSESNAGSRAVADDVVYYCTRVRVGSDDAELFVGGTPRPWTRLYEWVKMDWGYGLRNLGGFLGWGANYGDQTFSNIAADKDPFWTDNSESFLNNPTGQPAPPPAP